MGKDQGPGGAAAAPVATCELELGTNLTRAAVDAYGKYSPNDAAMRSLVWRQMSTNWAETSPRL